MLGYFKGIDSALPEGSNPMVVRSNDNRKKLLSRESCVIKNGSFLLGAALSLFWFKPTENSSLIPDLQCRCGYGFCYSCATPLISHQCPKCN
ncbi:hypothetical protein ACET3Z_010804 [Daucus carota]